jgi:hypothetical protein
LRKAAALRASSGLQLSLPGNSLPVAEAAEWRRLIDQAGFFDLPEVIPAGPGRDQFQYKVAVELDGRRHTVEVNDGAIPKPMEPLMDRLKQTARG